jgi:Flp pilus assembly protein TadD
MRGDLTRATGWLKKAQDVQPDSAAAHAGLGVVLMQQNRLEESADSLFRAVERDPKSREYREALNAVLNRLAATGRSDLARQISERLNRL